MTDIDTLSDELVQQAKDMANENAVLRASHDTLLEAFKSIAGIEVGGPHISAAEGMRASLTALGRARIIARKALAAATP